MPDARWVRRDGELLREFAERMIAERKAEGIFFNEDQIDFLALVVSKLEATLPAKESGSVVGVEQMVVLLHGQGGSGKAELVKFVREIIKAYLEEESIMTVRPQTRQRELSAVTPFIALFI